MADLKLTGLGLRSYGDIIFNTDAAYDIGKSGATRPRDLFLTRNAVIGGTLGVTGVATFTAVPVFSAGIGTITAGAVPASLVTAGTFGAGAYTFPGALAITGALTGVTTLAVSSTSTLTGNVGIHAASIATIALRLGGSNLLTGVDQYGVYVGEEFGSGATTSARSAYINFRTAAAAFTTVGGYGLHIDTPTIGNTAVTTIYGAYIANQGQAKSTTAYGVYIAAQSGAATTNIGLYIAGSGLQVNAGGMSVGIGPGADVGLHLRPTLAASSGLGYALKINAGTTFASDTTIAGYGIYVAPTTSAAAFVMATRYGIYVANTAKGAGSTITNDYGLYLEAPTQGGTLNIGLYNAGTTTLVGNVGIGTAPAGNFAISLAKDLSAGGANQTGIRMSVTVGGTLVNAYGYYGQITTSSASAITTAHTIYAGPPIPGGGGATLGTIYGAYISNNGATGITNAYGVYIEAQSGAATTNIGLYNLGTSRFDGTIGIGIAPATNIAMRLTAQLTSTGTTQYGLYVDSTFTSAATSEMLAVYAKVRTAAASYTTSFAYALYAAVPTLGASSAITTAYGLFANNQGAAGITNAYGVYIEAVSGAATTNIGLYNGGSTSLQGITGHGIAPTANFAVRLRADTLTIGTTVYGFANDSVYAATVTASAYSHYSSIGTAAAVFTLAAGYNYIAAAPALGAGSAVTNMYGFYAMNQGVAGVTNAYGLYIQAQSGAATTNIGLYNAGTTTLVGALTASTISGTTGSFSGNVTLTGTRPTVVAGSGAAPSRFGQVLNNRAEFSRNVWYDGSNWNLDNVASPGSLIRSVAGTPLGVGVFSAGANPRTESLVWSIDDSGNVTNAGTLAVTGTSTLTGNVGIHAASIAPIALRLGGSNLLTGVDQYGVYVEEEFGSGATTSARSAYINFRTAAAAFTTVGGYGLHIDTPTIGNTAVTNIYGAYIENQGQAKSTNAYGVYIAAQSGAGTINMALYNAGRSQLMGAVGIGKAPTATSPFCATGIPTSAAGLASGDVWANSNVLTIVP